MNTRQTWLCVLACLFLTLHGQTQADERTDDYDVPAPSTELKAMRRSLSDQKSPGVRDKVAERTELDEARQHLRSHSLRRISASINAPSGEFPPHQSLDDDGASPQPLDNYVVPNFLLTPDYSRPWAFSCYEWEAPMTRHLPLLFEEPNLERLGYVYGVCDIGICEGEPRRGQRLQALVSGVNFFGRIPFIPCMAGTYPLTEPVYTLGVDRPGSPVPYRKYLPDCFVYGQVD